MISKEDIDELERGFESMYHIVDVPIQNRLKDAVKTLRRLVEVEAQMSSPQIAGPVIVEEVKITKKAAKPKVEPLVVEEKPTETDNAA